MPSLKERLLSSLPAVILIISSIPCLILKICNQNSQATNYLMSGVLIFILCISIHKIKYFIASKIPTIRFIVSHAALVQVFTTFLIIIMALSIIRITQDTEPTAMKIMYVMFIVIIPIIIFKNIKKIWRFLSGKQYFIV